MMNLCSRKIVLRTSIDKVNLLQADVTPYNLDLGLEVHKRIMYLVFKMIGPRLLCTQVRQVLPPNRSTTNRPVIA
jgi:hypothetical protein